MISNMRVVVKLKLSEEIAFPWHITSAQNAIIHALIKHFAVKVKVKSAYEPGDPSGRSLLRSL